ncbi:MAG TPA: Spy/CpxP family protein refolding chaperone [Acidobacteriota bacterium]
MKKRAVALSVILGFLLFALLPLAAQEEPGPVPVPREGAGPGPQKWLDLTPDQQTKLKEIKNLRQEAMKGFREQHTKMREELNTLMADPQADQKKVEGLIDEMAKLQAAHMKSSFKFRQDMEKILTPQQLEKLKKAKTAFQRVRGGHRFFMRHPGARRFMGNQFFGRRGFNRPGGMRFRHPGQWNRMFWEW